MLRGRDMAGQQLQCFTTVPEVWIPTQLQTYTKGLHSLPLNPAINTWSLGLKSQKQLDMMLSLVILACFKHGSLGHWLGRTLDDLDTIISGGGKSQMKIQIFLSSVTILSLSKNHWWTSEVSIRLYFFQGSPTLA